MQKKLLSLVVIATMIVADNVSCNQETVPVISDAQHAENDSHYRELANKINALNEQLLELRAQKDAIESDLLYSYDERNKFQAKLFSELTRQDGAIAQQERNSYKAIADENDDRKKKNNGIDRAWFSGVTAPMDGTPVAQDYARMDSISKKEKDITERLSREHKIYRDIVLKEILPTTKDDLTRRINMIELSYIRAFKVCDCYLGDEYYQCLGNEGINKEQVSESFVDNFVRASYIAAYQQAVKKGIPLTPEKVSIIIEENKVTKEAAARLTIAAEELKKALRRDQLNPPIIQKPEEKLSILDPKENQDDQGALSQ